jgi:hypothetical protein
MPLVQEVVRGFQDVDGLGARGARRPRDRAAGEAIVPGLEGGAVHSRVVHRDGGGAGAREGNSERPGENGVDHASRTK